MKQKKSQNNYILGRNHSAVPPGFLIKKIRRSLHVTCATSQTTTLMRFPCAAPA